MEPGGVHKGKTPMMCLSVPIGHSPELLPLPTSPGFPSPPSRSFFSQAAPHESLIVEFSHLFLHCAALAFSRKPDTQPTTAHPCGVQCFPCGDAFVVRVDFISPAQHLYVDEFYFEGWLVLLLCFVAFSLARHSSIGEYSFVNHMETWNREFFGRQFQLLGTRLFRFSRLF